MKKILMLLALSVGLRADIVGPTLVQELDGQALGPVTGSLTYALNQALTGVASTAIDLSGTSGIYLTLTSTGSANIDLRFTNSNVTYGAKTYTLQSGYSYAVPVRGRYLTLYNSGTNLPTARTSAYYYAAGLVGSQVNATIGGTVTANQGTAGAAAWPVALSATPSYATLSDTTATLTSAYSMNVSHAAGVAGVNGYAFSFSALGPSAGMYWARNNSATPPSSFGSYYAVSTTPIWARDLAPGTHLHLSATAAAATVTVKVEYSVKQ